MLKAFEEEKINIDYISGTSSGSIIAALFAMGYNSNEIYYLFNRYSKKIKYINYKNILKLIYGILVKRKIIIKGFNDGKIIEKIIDDAADLKNIKNINQIKMPLFISMVDLQTGTVYIASSNENRTQLLDDTQYITDIPISTAVRGSCSFPVIFSPCKFENIQLIDGGTRENLPWKCLKDVGANEVIGICFETIHKKECCKNIIEVATRAMELQERELSSYEKDGIDKLITINLEKTSLLDSENIYELYKQGYNQAKKYISNN